MMNMISALMSLATSASCRLSPDRSKFASTLDEHCLVLKPGISRRSIVVKQIEPVTENLGQISRRNSEILHRGVSGKCPVACLIQMHSDGGVAVTPDGGTCP